MKIQLLQFWKGFFKFSKPRYSFVNDATLKDFPVSAVPNSIISNTFLKPYSQPFLRLFLVIVKVRTSPAIFEVPKSVSRSSSGVFLKVFWLTLFPDRSPPTDLLGLPRTFSSFCGNYARYSHFRPKKVIFGIFWKFSFFVIFSLMGNFCLKSLKITKMKILKIDQIWLFLV